MAKLARFANSQSRQACVAMQRVFRYLSGHDDLGITFHKEECLELVGYVDSDFAGDRSSGIAGKSTTGFLFKLGEKSGAISARSKLQSTTATSTQHAEYIALFEAVKEGIYIRSILRDIGLLKTPEPATVIFEDNSACLQLAHNPVHHDERNKHYEVKLHYIREMVEEGSIKVVKISSEENIADLLTKAVGPNILGHLVDGLMGVPGYCSSERAC